MWCRSHAYHAKVKTRAGTAKPAVRSKIASPLPPATETRKIEISTMAKKKSRPILATAPDLLQQLRDSIKSTSPYDGAWDAMDGGKMTPMKLAVAMVLWPECKCLKNAGIDSPLGEQQAIGDGLWAAVEKIRYESMIAELEALVRDKGDGHEPTHGRVLWVEAVLSVEPPKRPDHICSECRIQVDGNPAFCTACHVWDARWRAIEEVRSRRTRSRTRLEAVLKKHEFPLEYLDRIARLPNLATEFHELAMTVQARIKTLRDEGGRNLKAVKGLRLALQQSDELKIIFRRNEVAATDLVEKLHRIEIEVDLATEIARASVPTVAMQSYLEFLSISQTSGAPVKADGRQRDVVIDGMFSIWKECKGKAPAANPSAHEKTPFVKLLEDIFPALERKSWVTGLEKAAIRVRRERVAKCKLAAPPNSPDILELGVCTVPE